MRKFTVQVNGSTYDVEVEEIASSEGSHQKVKTREEYRQKTVVQM